MSYQHDASQVSTEICTFFNHFNTEEIIKDCGPSVTPLHEEMYYVLSKTKVGLERVILFGWTPGQIKVALGKPKTDMNKPGKPWSSMPPPPLVEIGAHFPLAQENTPQEMIFKIGLTFAVNTAKTIIGKGIDKPFMDLILDPALFKNLVENKTTKYFICDSDWLKYSRNVKEKYYKQRFKSSFNAAFENIGKMNYAKYNEIWNVIPCVDMDPETDPEVLYNDFWISFVRTEKLPILPISNSATESTIKKVTDEKTLEILEV